MTLKDEDDLLEYSNIWKVTEKWSFVHINSLIYKASYGFVAESSVTVETGSFGMKHANC